MYQHVRKWRSRTFGNDVARHDATTAPPQKLGRKGGYILLTVIVSTLLQRFDIKITCFYWA